MAQLRPSQVKLHQAEMALKGPPTLRDHDVFIFIFLLLSPCFRPKLLKLFYARFRHESFSKDLKEACD